jgi:putative glycosyltransferase (TIGR04372 family)
MIFIQRQIKQICSGGLPVLSRKIGAFSRGSLHWFIASKYGSRVAYYGFKMGVSSRPNWAVGHALLAETLISLGRFDEAMDAWEQALLLKLNPDWLYTNWYIMWALLVRGQTGKACSVIQMFIDTQNDFAREHQLDKLGVRFLCGESTTGIGSIAYLDHYVKMGILGQRSTTHPVLLISPELSNPCYVDYWRRYLPDMITDPVAIEMLWPLAKYLEDRFGAVMDSSGQQIYELYTGGRERAIHAQWEMEGRGHLLTLSDSDHERGWQCLRSLGVPAGAWFVGLQVRDCGDITYPRNSDIYTYRLAIESIVKRGGWVIRMGNPLMPPLPAIPQVIDYVHSQVRSDWMDVFLWARCRFFIGTQSGPSTVPPTFGVPCVLTNWPSLGCRPWFNEDLCIFKLHWSEREARYLNFEEVISSALAWAECAGYRASQGIKLIDNTPEEIRDVVVEMLDRLDGKLQFSKEDNELQERFDSMNINNAHKSNARIGRGFLRKWAHLL